MISEEMEQLVKLFDFALSSDNPSVKKALKNLLLLVSIVEPEENNKAPGPLSQLQTEIMTLRREILKLHNDVALIKEKDRLGGTPMYPYPGTLYPNTTQFPPYRGTWVVNTSSNTTSNAVSTPSIMSSAVDPALVPDIDATTIASLIQEYNINLKDVNVT
jgi:hypothetical protein